MTTLERLCLSLAALLSLAASLACFALAIRHLVDVPNLLAICIGCMTLLYGIVAFLLALDLSYAALISDNGEMPLTNMLISTLEHTE